MLFMLPSRGEGGWKVVCACACVCVCVCVCLCKGSSDNDRNVSVCDNLKTTRVMLENV